MSTKSFMANLGRLRQSKAFWGGFVDGMIPEYYLFVRPTKRLRQDSLRYSWSAVGKSLNEALRAVELDDTKIKGEITAKRREHSGGNGGPGVTKSKQRAGGNRIER
jgi:hypothetical protein